MATSAERRLNRFTIQTTRPESHPHPRLKDAMFCIDGERLDTLHPELGQLISPLCRQKTWPDDPGRIDEAVAQLLCEAGPGMREGRRPLLVEVCGCCGALGAKIQMDGDVVVWSDFMVDENDETLPFDGAGARPDAPIPVPIGPYRFDRGEYEAAIRQASSPIKDIMRQANGSRRRRAAHGAPTIGLG